MVDKEDMIEGFEELFTNAKMEIMSNQSDIQGNRQLLGQVHGFFMAMWMVLPLVMEEIQYVEHRLNSLQERIR